MCRQCFKMFSHFRIASGMAQNGNTSATKTMGQEIVKLLPEVYFATMLAGNWSEMRRQCFRMFSHLWIASGMAQNGNTLATKTIGQEIMKLLLEVYFAPMLAGKLSKMRRQCFRMFSYFRIASGTTQNGNTSATKIMCQEIMKMLLQVYFATMLAGKLSKMHQQSFKMFFHLWISSGMAKKWQYIGHKNNGSRNHAGSVFNACQNIIQYLSAVFQNVFPHLDCLWHCPKFRKIGTKSSKEFIPDVV